MMLLRGLVAEEDAVKGAQGRRDSLANPQGGPQQQQSNVEQTVPIM